MVVKTSESPRSAFLGIRVWHKGVATTVDGLASFVSAAVARRNARGAVIALACARREREEVQAVLADYASARAA